MASDLIFAKKNQYHPFFKTIFTIIVIFLVVAIILLNIFTHLLPVVRYYGDGMEPTLSNGQILLISKTAKISEGDVVAFYYNNKILVRRVICLGGNQISIEKDGSVSVNGKYLDEPYLLEKSIGQCNLEFPYYVAPNNVFVMGDSRALAMDSRLKEVGTISMDRILGKVLFVQ